MSKAELRPGELGIENSGSNHIQGRIMHGGRFVLATERLAFSPHRLDQLLRGQMWECELRSISSLTKAPRRRRSSNGSLRRRLQIDRHGTTDFFVVAHVDAFIAAVESVVARGPNNRTAPARSR